MKVNRNISVYTKNSIENDSRVSKVVGEVIELTEEQRRQLIEMYQKITKSKGIILTQDRLESMIYNTLTLLSINDTEAFNDLSNLISGFHKGLGRA